MEQKTMEQSLITKSKMTIERLIYDCIEPILSLLILAELLYVADTSTKIRENAKTSFNQKCCYKVFILVPTADEDGATPKIEEDGRHVSIR